MSLMVTSYFSIPRWGSLHSVLSQMTQTALFSTLAPTPRDSGLSAWLKIAALIEPFTSTLEGSPSPLALHCDRQALGIVGQHLHLHPFCVSLLAAGTGEPFQNRLIWKLLSFLLSLQSSAPRINRTKQKPVWSTDWLLSLVLGEGKGTER